MTANGTPTAGTLTPATANESVDVIDKTTGVNLVKSVTAPTVLGGANATFTDAGDTVTYTYTITNTGNVSLGAVAITDPGPTFDGNPLGGTWVAPTLTSGDTDSDNRIDPTETWVYNTTYTLVQGDVDNALGVTNGVSNTASVATQDPDAVPVTTPGVCPTCTAETTITGTPTLAVTKVATYDLGAGVVTADGTTDNVPVGTVITYTYTITNTGPVTIDNVTLADAHLGTGTVPVPDPDGATLTDNLPAGGSSNTPSGDNDYDVLAPGDMLTVTATYTVDQGDIDAQ
ncbi:MAG: hypothetical protein IPL47_08200 [Phyllobacteriaceae bacterium]|nr:hypothetical protein [Phyllobacteriaceae bacterium]